ncbi:MAG: hypothetical protein AAF942_08280 [Pseudomonadota bacterium]
MANPMVVAGSSRRAPTNAVPPEMHGQASGITMTARLLGGTFSMAVGSTLLTATGSYQIVFLTTAGLLIAVLVIGSAAIERPRPG